MLKKATLQKGGLFYAALKGEVTRCRTGMLDQISAPYSGALYLAGVQLFPGYPMRSTAYSLVLEGERLTVTTSHHRSFFDPRYLVAALLDHVARGDGEVSDEESSCMVDTVASHFGLDAAGAEQKLKHALNLYSRNMDLETVGEILGEVLEPEERENVMLMMLELVAADGRQGADELRAVDEVADVIGITPEQRHAAFQRYFASLDDQ